MIRSSCVFCESSYFQILYTLSNTPVAFYGTENKENSISKDQTWICCNSCGTVQLQTLIEPELLYGVSHNNTYETPTWKQHHDLFSEFIKNNRKYDKLIEIGGGNGVLASKLFDGSFEYSVLDLFDPTSKLDNVKYYIHNCETYCYNNYTSAVLSHVFEHLYKPLEFIKRISEANVKEVFISVPNLKHNLETKSISFINNEHTFYFEDADLVNIFSKYKYRLENKLEFKKHSIFFHFILDHNYISKEAIYFNQNYYEQFKLYFKEREETLSSIEVKENTFIIPSGHFGSIIYQHIKDKSKIIGFLDNDIIKQNKYLYGTDLLTYPMDYIYNYNMIHLVLHAGPYTEEITKQLVSYNSNAKIININ